MCLFLCVIGYFRYHGLKFKVQSAVHMDKSRTESEMLSRSSFSPFIHVYYGFSVYSRKTLVRAILSSITRNVSPRTSFTDPIVRNFRCKTLGLISTGRKARIQRHLLIFF